MEVAVNEEGRSQHFATGQSEVRQPSFQTRQQGQGGGAYKAKSVLEPFIQNSGIGLGASDKPRQLASGGLLDSQNGKSKGTYQASQWLDSPYRTVG